MSRIIVPLNYSGATQKNGLSYPSVVLKDAPVAYWPLNETSGTVAHDLSGNNNDGAISGDITLNQPGIPGIPGSFFFNNGQISAVNNYIYGDSTVTLEIWCKGTNNENMQLFDAGAANVTFEAFQFGLPGSTNNGIDGFGSGAGAYFAQWGIDSYIQTPNLYDGNWHHFVIVRQGLLVYIYIDSVLLNGYAQNSSGGWSYGPQPLSIYTTPNTAKNPILIGYARSGIWGTGLSFWIGNISNVAIYNKALTASQVQKHYNTGNSL